MSVTNIVIPIAVAVAGLGGLGAAGYAYFAHKVEVRVETPPAPEPRVVYVPVETAPPVDREAFRARIGSVRDRVVVEHKNPFAGR